MKKPDFKNMWKATKKKPLHLRKSSLWMGAFLVVFLIVLSCGVLFAGESEPENPIGDKNDSFDTASVIMNCESDEDDNVYVPVPVATEPDQSTESEQSSSGVNGQEEQQQDPKEEDPQQEEQQTPPEQVPQEEKITKPAASARSDKNNNAAPNGGGGTSGGTDPSGEKADKVYFTTTIKDGETVTEKVLPFNVKHKYDELKPTKFTVSVNGTEVPQNSLTSCKVELIEGENTIRVAVTYLDSAGKVVATPYKDYTVTLDTKSLVIDTSLKDGETVENDFISFTASASYQGKSVPVEVQLNGKKLSGTSGSYDAKLKAGTNTFILTAKGGNISKKEEIKINYVSSGKITIRTNLPEETYDSPLTFKIFLNNASDSATLNVRVNNKKPLSLEKLDVNSYICIADLSPGQNSIRVIYRDGGENVPETFPVYLKRHEAGPDNDNPDPAHAPTIKEINITDGMETNSSRMNLFVQAVDYQGNILYNENAKVYVNGALNLGAKPGNAGMTYPVDFIAGANLIEIYLKDSQEYSRYYRYTVNYVPVTGPIGNATVSVEGTTLGLGYIVPPTQIPIYDNESAAYVVDRLLQANNITFDYGGSFDSNFYLQRIYFDGIMRTYAIPEKLQEYLEQDKISINYNNYEENSLGEKDFTSGSGWMVAVNGRYPGYGFSDMRLTDGAVVKIRFTLNLGKDIGDDSGASTSGNYPEIFVEP